MWITCIQNQTIASSSQTWTNGKSAQEIKTGFKGHILQQLEAKSAAADKKECNTDVSENVKYPDFHIKHGNIDHFSTKFLP